MANQKQTLILLPGVLNTEAIWQKQISALQRDYKLYYPTIHHYDCIEDTAKAILNGIQEEYFSIAGFSMGGYVALEMLRQAPERINRLGLINSSAEQDSPKVQQERRNTIKNVGAQYGRFQGITPRLFKRLVHPEHKDDQEMYSISIKMAQIIGAQGFVKQQKAILSRPDSKASLANFSKPVLLLSSDHDQIIALEKTFAAQKIVPQARQCLIQGAGHLTPLEKPQAVIESLEGWMKL